MPVFGEQKPVRDLTHADERALAVVAIVFDETQIAVKRYVKQKDCQDEALRHIRAALVMSINSIKEVGIH